MVTGKALREWAKKTQKAPKPVLEKHVQKAITDYLKLVGIEHSVTDASRAFTKDGRPRRSKVDSSHPDITAVLPVMIDGIRVGLGFYIEVKRPEGGVISPEQKIKLQTLCDLGCIAIVARSIDDIKWITAWKDQPYTQTRQTRIKEVLDLQLNQRQIQKVKERIKELMVSTDDHYDNNDKNNSSDR